MSQRLLRYLFVVLLLVGQVGSWLHEWSHLAAAHPLHDTLQVVDSATDSQPGQGEADGGDGQCLLCLSYAVLALALLPGLLVLALRSVASPLPGTALRLALVFRWLAFPARGPPRLS
jgi:hypothetical protein